MVLPLGVAGRIADERCSVGVGIEQLVGERDESCVACCAGSWLGVVRDGLHRHAGARTAVVGDGGAGFEE
jgi:hypothetical protein